MSNKNDLRLPAMPTSTTNELAEIVARQAASSGGDPKNFLKMLVESVDMPELWKWQIIGGWAEDVRYNALRLINWAKSKGINQEDPNPEFTLLGSILNEVLQYVGRYDARIIAAVILSYRLCLDEHLRENIAIQYQVPQIMLSLGQTWIDSDAWLGPIPENDVELQSWLKPDPPMLEIEFLKHAVEQASTVCYVELPEKNRQGTGFLIADNLVLTNYHLLRWSDDEDIYANAQNVELCFGYTTRDSGQTFKLTDNPILKSSPKDKLDYVLLRVDERITYAEGIKPVNYYLGPLSRDMALHIIQHPQGKTMQLAINSNGVTSVYQDSGLVHYVTRTKGGSSGSPCFNENWKVVALHHAERAKSFGSIGEGILFRLIHEEIKGFLPK